MRAHEHPALNHRMTAVGGVLEDECRALMQDVLRSAAITLVAFRLSPVSPAGCECRQSEGRAATGASERRESPPASAKAPAGGASGRLAEGRARGGAAKGPRAK